jgi:hypothetical protein
MTTILTKKKDTAGAPVAGDLTNSAGGAELAVNTATKRLYTKDSGGNVVEIGTNPSSLDVPVVISGTTTDAALRVTQLGTGNALLVEDATNPDATAFAIDSTGTVLVGNTTAQTISGITPAYQQLGANNYAAMWLGRYSANNSANFIYLTKSRSATVGTNTIVQSGDDLGTLAFYGADGTDLISAASILGEVDGTPGTSDMPGRLVFSTTADGASTVTERMRIDSAGNVSIGATAAAAGTTLRLSKNITGSTTSYGVLNGATVQSDVTTAVMFYTSPGVAVSTVLSNLRHFTAAAGTYTGTVTNQEAFLVGSDITGATNNYGFRVGDIGGASATTGKTMYGVHSAISTASGGGSAWNLYINGTADNYFAGDVGIGTTNPITKLEIAGSNNTTWQLTDRNCLLLS